MLYALLYLAFGIAALIYSAYVLWQRGSVRGWPTTRGEFLERKVERSPKGRAGRTAAPAFQYEALVKYCYQVEGRDYVCDRLYRVGWVTSTRKNRQALLARLPDPPAVRYNPADPRDACLLALPLSSAIWGLAVGAAITVTALLYLAVKLLDRPPAG